LSDDNSGAAVKNSEGNTLFYIQEKTNTASGRPGIFSVIFRIAAIILIIIFLNGVAAEIIAARGFLTGFLLLAGIVILFRVLTYYMPFPFNLKAFELFDPTIYASSSF